MPQAQGGVVPEHAIEVDAARLRPVLDQEDHRPAAVGPGAEQGDIKEGAGAEVGQGQLLLHRLDALGRAAFGDELGREDLDGLARIGNEELFEPAVLGDVGHQR